MRKLLFWILILLIAAGGYYAYQHHKAGTADSGKKRGKGTPIVQVAKANLADVPLIYSTFSHVQASQSVAILPRIDGQISEIAVKDGQSVKAGDVLFTLDDRVLKADLAQARANLAKDQASLAGARSTLSRNQAMFARKAISEQSVEDARTSANALVAAVAADKAAVDLATTQLSYTTITAPFAGTLGNISVDIGSNVKASATTALVTLNNIDPVKATFALPERFFDRLKGSMHEGTVPVTLTLPGSTGETSVEGHVLYIDNSIDSTSGTLPVYAEFPNDAHALWPGQYARISLQLALEKQVLVIPQVAVKDGPDSVYVFVLKPDHSVHQQPVTLERIAGDKAIISEGLKAGDEVVTLGLINLRDGTKVQLQQADGQKKDKAADKQEAAQ